jgi:hypothetical protein
MIDIINRDSLVKLNAMGSCRVMDGLCVDVYREEG